MRAAAARAADVNCASNAACRVWSGIGRVGVERIGQRQAQLLGLQRFADLGANANQVSLGRHRIALAKCQRHAHRGGLGNGDAAARRVQPDDVAHQHVAAKLAGAAHTGVFGHVCGVAQTNQGLTHLGQRFTRLVQRHVQIGQHHAQGRLPVQFGDHIGVASGDEVVARHRLTPLRDTRHQAKTARLCGQRAGRRFIRRHIT